MSPALSPGPETAPMRWRSGFEIKNVASPTIIATFSRHTCFPILKGMTADQCDILVSLSPNLKRFFSRTFSTDARFFEVNRSRYCLKVSDPIIILAHPVSMIPLPGLEFSIASYSPLARSRSILCFFAFSSNDQRCSRRLRILSSREQCLLSKKHRRHDSCCGLQSQKWVSPSFLVKKLVFPR